MGTHMYIYIHMIICLSRGNIQSYEYIHIYIVYFVCPKRGFLSLITEDCALQNGAGQMFNQPITGPIPGVS
jgi:hypothetical protein